jgi:hypothetical protein
LFLFFAENINFINKNTIMDFNFNRRAIYDSTKPLEILLKAGVARE